MYYICTIYYTCMHIMYYIYIMYMAMNYWDDKHLWCYEINEILTLESLLN